MKSILIILKKYKAIVIGVILIAIAFFVILLAKTGLSDISSNFNPFTTTPTTFKSDQELSTKLYFNNELGGKNGLDPIVDVINGAHRSLEMAMFSFSSAKVKQALYEAAKRGVKITLVLDLSRKDKHDDFLSDLPKGIERIDVGESDTLISKNTSYMHEKFVISDRGDANEVLVTGSLNFTEKAEGYEQSFLLSTKDSKIIDIYGKEFDLLKGKIHGVKKFAQTDYHPWAGHLIYNDSFVDMWFSPGTKDNSIKNKILELINGANKSIDLMMWQFTDNDIAEALKKQAEKGVKIRLIADDLVANTMDSEVSRLKVWADKEKIKNLEVILDSKSLSLLDLNKFQPGFNPFIHQHMMIVDNSTIVFGTNNWSKWGFYYNDEDTLVTNNRYIIDEFSHTFSQFYDFLK